MTPRKTFQQGTLLMLRLVSPTFPACWMKLYKHISILLTWDGNRTQGNARGAATRAGNHLFTGMLLPEMRLRKCFWSVAKAVVVAKRDSVRYFFSPFEEWRFVIHGALRVGQIRLLGNRMVMMGPRKVTAPCQEINDPCLSTTCSF